MDTAWVKRQWHNINLGDVRLNKRAIRVAKALARNPRRPIARAFDEWSGVKAAYRLCASENASHQDIQKPHYEEVIKQAKKGEDAVLFVQDGSELLYNSQPCINGLGPTADASGQGLMMHTCLAVRFDQGQTDVLGLASQTVWVRDEASKKKRNESHVWLETLKKIGSPPPKSEWITVGDRGSDIHDFMCGAKELGWDFVVRAKYNRHIVVDGKRDRLFDWIRRLTAGGSTTMYLRARNAEEFSGEAELVLSWGNAAISPPATARTKETACFSFVRVHCPKRPKLEWIVTTSLPIESADDALRIMEIYRRRWLIEDYHKALKTGCRIEESQLKYAGRILVLLGFLGVIATQLLALRQWARLEPNVPAIERVDSRMLQLVSAYYRLKNPTLREFWVCVARLGGFLARKGDGDPGWLTIWEGYNRLQDMVLGAEIFNKLVRCG